MQMENDYLDFGAGIAVFALGYGNEAYNDALKAQVDQAYPHFKSLLQCTAGRGGRRSWYKASGMDKVFFHEQRNGSD